MVSYYNTMYRHQQAMPTSPNAHFQTNGSLHSWYSSGYHNGTQMGTQPATYLPQEEPQIWHHHGAGHGVFQHDFQDFVHTGIPALQPHGVEPENQLPSPPITVSGSEMSSPGGQSGNISPPQQMGMGARPPTARSPYEWIKKTSYQTQPNPGKTRTKDKYRVVYTDHQRIQLEKEFTFVNKYITIRRKSELAAELGLSERQVKIWFQNRRAKERKQNKKRVEEKNQMDLYTNVNLAGQSHMDQQVLPSLVPPPNPVLQRYMHDQHQPMKMEANEGSEQLG
ncbi:homeobox protein CHOX-CAD-like isoform X2 [Cylas formicarius]|uniref:homeobox protein CHOX-CAD-like isoform X2 n=1 Tax=Cylas formicarius TaxID=197179 RepID=UPI002958B55B|nr:homeobox protein CHOX-CAD-like isoform X2 [Cylas formicarius]